MLDGENAVACCARTAMWWNARCAVVFSAIGN